jgi:hypothetical protein
MVKNIEMKIRNQLHIYHHDRLTTSFETTVSLVTFRHGPCSKELHPLRRRFDIVDPPVFPMCTKPAVSCDEALGGIVWNGGLKLLCWLWLLFSRLPSLSAKKKLGTKKIRQLQHPSRMMMIHSCCFKVIFVENDAQYLVPFRITNDHTNKVSCEMRRLFVSLLFKAVSRRRNDKCWWLQLASDGNEYNSYFFSPNRELVTSRLISSIISQSMTSSSNFTPTLDRTEALPGAFHDVVLARSFECVCCCWTKRLINNKK